MVASIVNFAFIPVNVTVTKGATVTWTNTDSAPHTVTSDGGAFSSSTLADGGTFSHRFTTTGTFVYHCAVHPSMAGTVIVSG